MQGRKKHFLILASSVLIVTAIQAVVLCLLRFGVLRGGWFLALYLPIMLGLVIFTSASYTVVPVDKSWRMLRAVGGGLGLTLLWFTVFILLVMVITKWGGTLLTVDPK